MRLDEPVGLRRASRYPTLRTHDSPLCRVSNGVGAEELSKRIFGAIKPPTTCGRRAATPHLGGLSDERDSCRTDFKTERISAPINPFLRLHVRCGFCRRLVRPLRTAARAWHYLPGTCHRRRPRRTSVDAAVSTESFKLSAIPALNSSRRSSLSSVVPSQTHAGEQHPDGGCHSAQQKRPASTIVGARLFEREPRRLLVLPHG